jgi:hypothetical protein
VTRDTGPRQDAGRRNDGGEPECTRDQDCESGLCVGGSCCPSQEQACGDSCCGSDQVCFANACVTPGDSCLSRSDCGEGEFCEKSLGDSGDDNMCMGRGVQTGRCIELPPQCEGGSSGQTCIRECEFEPDFDTLRPTEQWHWQAEEFPRFTDVWTTPTVGRLVDRNCDGIVDENDPPNVVFVSGFSKPTQCAAKCMEPSDCDCQTPDDCGPDGCTCTDDGHPNMGSACRRAVLRVVDGKTGEEIWSLRRPSPESRGFAGTGVALADLMGDDRMEIAALSGEGRIVIVDAAGEVLATSERIVDGGNHAGFGWGGGLSIADMNGDGNAEVIYGRSIFTVREGSVTHVFSGSHDDGGRRTRAVSFPVDLDGDGTQELLAGRTAYDPYDPDDQVVLWNKSSENGFVRGYSGVGDFDDDGAPDAVLVGQGKVFILEGSTGALELGPTPLGEVGRRDNGGPPTVADFDGDGSPEIGVAEREEYFVLEPDYGADTLSIKWRAPNHDLSSSVTGSTVFDFEGDGRAEVVYNDECYLWVYRGTEDGEELEVLTTIPTTSFTATEETLVADVDGDGHAEILMGSNGADPTAWSCEEHMEPADGSPYPAWTPPENEPSYRGLRLFRDEANSWVGTRPLWNQHAYRVTNICSGEDDACDSDQAYGTVPRSERPNWSIPWLNNLRQNVQQEGLFDAPDAVVELGKMCGEPLQLVAAVRNLGEAILPAGVRVGFFRVEGGSEQRIGTGQTTAPLFPGQSAEVPLEVDSSELGHTFRARILIEDGARTFRECREGNNTSEPFELTCVD